MIQAGYAPFYGLINLFEWGTRYVLPWIALYWLVHLVKVIKADRNNEEK